MKRLLCIVGVLDAGGAETFLMKVYRALPTDKYQIDFVVSTEGGCYTDEVLARGGRIYSIPERKKDPLNALGGIAKIVKSNRYDYVLKLGDAPIAGLDLVAAMIGGAKCRAMRSCNAPVGLSKTQKLANLLLRPVLNSVSNVKIAPSMLAAEFLFGKKNARTSVHMLRNGIDTIAYSFDAEGRRKIREEFSIREKKLVIGHIGRFVEQKNHSYLLDVFQEIKKRREDAILLMVGTGEGEALVRSRVKGLGLEDDVLFAGVRFDVPQLLSAMDVFVFPSLHEGMPNVVIEAQATGLPCVIADTITKEANITGLVSYLPLGEDKSIWADAAMKAAQIRREDTYQDFASHGYEISVVAREFVYLIFGDRI